MYPNCQKMKAFALFDAGKRPAEIFRLLPLKRETVFRYYQEWKAKKKAAARAAEEAALQRCLRQHLHSCEMVIENIRCYPGRDRTEDLRRHLDLKRRAEQLLKDPTLITPDEKKHYLGLYST